MVIVNTADNSAFVVSQLHRIDTLKWNLKAQNIPMHLYECKAFREKHSCYIASEFAAGIKENKGKLLTSYWSPKRHKTYNARFIPSSIS